LVSIADVVSEQSGKIVKGLDLIQRMENGEIVNHTSNVKESEDRQVDHYTLRMVEEKVAGKSLGKTLELWASTLKLSLGRSDPPQLRSTKRSSSTGSVETILVL
jgi:hypothetical protein